jgi:hypothetical protein
MKIKKTNKGYVINYSKEGDSVDYIQFSVVEINSKKVKTLFNELYDCSKLDTEEVFEEIDRIAQKFNAKVSVINDFFEVNYCPCCKDEGNPNSVAYIHVNYDFINNLSPATDKTLH